MEYRLVCFRHGGLLGHQFIWDVGGCSKKDDGIF